MNPRPNLFGPASAGHEARGGGILPTYRTHYPATIARQLHALAESRPTPAEYAREKARILEAKW